MRYPTATFLFGSILTTNTLALPRFVSTTQEPVTPTSTPPHFSTTTLPELSAREASPDGGVSFSALGTGPSWYGSSTSSTPSPQTKVPAANLAPPATIVTIGKTQAPTPAPVPKNPAPVAAQPPPGSVAALVVNAFAAPDCSVSKGDINIPVEYGKQYPVEIVSFWLSRNMLPTEQMDISNMNANPPAGTPKQCGHFLGTTSPDPAHHSPLGIGCHNLSTIAGVSQSSYEGQFWE